MLKELRDGDIVELLEGMCSICLIVVIQLLSLSLLSPLSLSLSPSLHIEPYTQRDVRTHVQRLKDLLSTNPLHQAMTCSDGLTLSFLAAITVNDPEGTADNVIYTCTC